MKTAKVTIVLEGDPAMLATLISSWREDAAEAVLRTEKRAEMAQGAPRFRASVMRCRDTCENVAASLTDALRLVDSAIDGSE